MRTSLPKLVATIAFSAAAFAVADSYAACLLSLPGQPASNLAAALSALPAWLASGSVGAARMARVRACAFRGGGSCRHGRRGRLRRVDRLGVRPHP